MRNERTLKATVAGVYGELGPEGCSQTLVATTDDGLIVHFPLRGLDAPKVGQEVEVTAAWDQPALAVR